MRCKQGCLLIAAAAMVMNLAGCNGESAGAVKADSPLSFEQMYFDEPEKAVEYYMNCISEQNYIQAVNGADVVSFAKENDLLKSIDRFGSYVPNMPMPNTQEYLDLNIASQYGIQVNQLKYFLRSLLAGGDADKALGGFKTSDSSAEEIYESFKADRLKDFKLLRCEAVDLDTYLADKTTLYEGYKSAMERKKTMSGQSDYRELLTLYQMEGKTYAGAVSCVKYDAGWVVADFSAMFREIQPYMLEPVTEGEFEAMLEK